MKNKGKFVFMLTMALFVAGCVSEHQSEVASSSSEKSVQSAKTSSVKKMLPVGDIISSKPNNPNTAYKMANKRVKFYRSLQEFGKKNGEYSDYETEKGAIFGISQIITATTGVYYHVIEYGSGGFNQKKDHADDMGYVKSSDLKRFVTVKSEWQYAKRKPYYLGSTSSQRIWNRPTYTIHYAHISHVFDRLAATQLYATKELIKYNGKHYVYLITAKGRRLGWTYKNKNVLIAGNYRDIGRQLLKPRSGERLTARLQSQKSTGNRVGVNDSPSLRQRIYFVRQGKKIKRVLVAGMDNRPTVIYFKNGQATRATGYTYRRKAWKSTTNKKKLRTKFTVVSEGADADAVKVHFYSKRSRKLVSVETDGYDGYAKAMVYRNGRTKFATRIAKEVATYPLADFK